MNIFDRLKKAPRLIMYLLVKSGLRTKNILNLIVTRKLCSQELQNVKECDATGDESSNADDKQ